MFHLPRLDEWFCSLERSSGQVTYGTYGHVTACRKPAGTVGTPLQFTGEWSLGNAGPWDWTNQDYTNFLRFHPPREGFVA
jgi:hypothetical protein